MMPKNEPAFPHVRDNGFAEEPGMTLRDYFAGQALPVIIADLAQDRNQTPIALMPAAAAKGAYMYADAMIAARDA